MNVKLIRGFIASPGGLESERRAAFAAAEEVDLSVARPMGGRLELIGWEETLSGLGEYRLRYRSPLPGPAGAR